MAGSNPYLHSEAENWPIFRDRIILGELDKVGPNFHPIEHPQMVINGGQRRQSMQMLAPS
jgi:hypothetical protein